MNRNNVIGFGWQIFDYVNHRGENEIRRWISGLEKLERTKLTAQLDILARLGPDEAPRLLRDTQLRNIKKISVKGRVQIRLLCTRGPIDPHGEITLLVGAFERDWQLQPKDAEERAAARRQEVAENPRQRRCPHERVS